MVRQNSSISIIFPSFKLPPPNTRGIYLAMQKIWNVLVTPIIIAWDSSKYETSKSPKISLVSLGTGKKFDRTLEVIAAITGSERCAVFHLVKMERVPSFCSVRINGATYVMESAIGIAFAALISITLG